MRATQPGLDLHPDNSDSVVTTAFELVEARIIGDYYITCEARYRAGDLLAQEIRFSFSDAKQMREFGYGFKFPVVIYVDDIYSIQFMLDRGLDSQNFKSILDCLSPEKTILDGANLICKLAVTRGGACMQVFSVNKNFEACGGFCR